MTVRYEIRYTTYDAAGREVQGCEWVREQPDREDRYVLSAFRREWRKRTGAAFVGLATVAGSWVYSRHRGVRRDPSRYSDWGDE